MIEPFDVGMSNLGWKMRVCENKDCAYSKVSISYILGLAEEDILEDVTASHWRGFKVYRCRGCLRPHVRVLNPSNLVGFSEYVGLVMKEQGVLGEYRS